MTRGSLAAQARHFGEALQEMLNLTVCDDVKVRALERPDGDVVLVGTALDKSLLTSRPVRLRSTASRAKLWIDVSFNLGLDSDEGFLAVFNSTWTINVGEQSNTELVLHYDYERDKQTYTEAHLQVAGSHPAFEAYLEDLGRKRGTLSKLHLPLGGRRFRPCLEDVIEFLAVEGLVDPKEGWQDVLARHRRSFRRIQIAALVRRNLDDAVAELKRLHYTVHLPSADTAVRALDRLRASSRTTPGAVAVARTVVSARGNAKAKKR